MRSKLQLITFFATALLFMSCIRQEIYDSSEVMNGAFLVKVPVAFDWSKADLDPNNDPEQNLYSASIWMFPTNGEKPFEFKLADCTKGIINVPEGEYNVIAFNNATMDYSTITFEGNSSYSDFRAVAKQQSNNRNSETTIQEPEILAAWSSEKVIISRDSASSSLMHIEPARLIYTLNIVAHVKNLVSARGASGVLKGIATGCYLASRERFDSSAETPFSIRSRAFYPDNSTDGTVTTSVRSFGAPNRANNQYTVDLHFSLYDDRESGPFSHDITHRLTRSTAPVYSLVVNTEIGDRNNHPIVLPEISNSADIEVEDWDEVVIPISI